MLTLVYIQVQKDGKAVSMSPSDFKAECDRLNGTLPIFDKMTIHNGKTGEISDCAASWSGLNRRIGHEVTIQTAAGTPVHRFVTCRLQMVGTA